MPDKPQQSPLADHGERRRQGRSRTLIGGTIIFRDGSGTVRCVVRNRTAEGIQLEIPPSQLLPKCFYLVTAKDDQVFEAELIWKKAGRIGVKIGKAIDPSTTNEKALQFLKKPKGADKTDVPAGSEIKVWDDDSRWPV